MGARHSSYESSDSSASTKSKKFLPRARRVKRVWTLRAYGVVALAYAALMGACYAAALTKHYYLMAGWFPVLNH